MTAYYNEIDKHAAAWLRELIAEGLIADGDVDERSIAEVMPDDLRGYTQCHFFAGIGGWSLAARLAGWPDDRELWSGSCPCQPFSVAGKGKGFSDERHLWPEFHRLIAQRKPPVVIGEQVASKDGRVWLAGVRADLEAVGYAVGAADLCAAGIGAPHIRQRIYWVADTECNASESGGAANQSTESAGEKRARPHGESGRCGGDGGMAYTCSERRQQERGRAPCNEGAHGWRESGDNLASSDGESGRMGNPISTRLEGHTGHECHRHEPGWIGAHTTGSTAKTGGDSGLSDASGERLNRQPVRLQQRESQLQGDEAARSGAWDDFLWIPCADGKARRIKPGLEPLAHGIQRGVVPSSDPGTPGYAEQTGEARIMRLRGYGNAIVPPLAAEFMRAYMECMAV